MPRVYGLVPFVKPKLRVKHVKRGVRFFEKYGENIILLLILLVIIVPSLVWTTKHFVSCLKDCHCHF